MILNMNKYLLTVRKASYEVSESRLRSILVFNSGFLHNDVDVLILTGKFVKRDKQTNYRTITYTLKKI
jgi:hypothetical protein